MHLTQTCSCAQSSIGSYLCVETFIFSISSFYSIQPFCIPHLPQLSSFLTIPQYLHWFPSFYPCVIPVFICELHYLFNDWAIPNHPIRFFIRCQTVSGSKSEKIISCDRCFGKQMMWCLMSYLISSSLDIICLSGFFTKLEGPALFCCRIIKAALTKTIGYFKLLNLLLLELKVFCRPDCCLWLHYCLKEDYANCINDLSSASPTDILL